MKINKPGIGVTLSKDEQKKIRGGNPCPIGTTVECMCADGTDIFTDQSPWNPLQLCNQTQFCGSHGGTVNHACV